VHPCPARVRLVSKRRAPK